jgi:photosystem II stability/assembly factor-like uncharacterized protein
MTRTAVAALLLTAAPLAFGLAAAAQPAPQWTMHPTGVSARLRGISAASERVVWASGTAGTVLRTADGGRSWQSLQVPDAAKLDFRDIDAIDERIAYVLSIGPGDASRIYKTTDAGASWTLQFRNEDPKAFFDAAAFVDARHGFALSDSVDGRFVLMRTTDGNAWTRVPPGDLPAALEGEGAFAASGTNVTMLRDSVWFATTHARVVRSTDRGRSWSVASAPLPSSASAGIFSIAFRDPRRGIVVGGDYKNERGAGGTCAMSEDGGATWREITGLGGFRSAVAFVPARGRTAVAVGPSGSDYSQDDGRTWRAIDGPGFHTLTVPRGSPTVWAAGENGAVGRLTLR